MAEDSGGRPTGSERLAATGSQRFTGFIAARPALVLLSWIGLALVAMVGLSRLEFATTPSSFLDRLAPEWNAYEASLERFGGDEIIVVAFEADEPFAPEALADVWRITRELEGIPGVRRVDSLATVPIVRAHPDGALELSPALGRERASPDEVRAAVAGDRIVPQSLVSSDGRTFAVNAVLAAGAEVDQGLVVEAAYRSLGPRPGWVSGVPVYEHRVGKRTRAEILTFVPLTLALIGALLFLAFRSLVALLVPALASGFAVTVVLGAMGFAGEPVTLVGMILPSVLLALGSAYVMHVLVAARGVREREALVLAIAEVVPPIALSGVTTAVGFFALTTIRIDAIRSLGAYGAAGVLVTLLASLTVAPALLALLPLPNAGTGLDGWIRTRLGPGLLAGAERRRLAVILVWTLLLAGAGFGVSRIRVETDAVRWWPPGSEMRDHYQAITDRLAGISPMNVVIESRGGGRVIDPEALASIDALALHLAEHPDVGKVLSVADPLRQLHGGFVGDPGQPLPEGRELVSQYLLLLESMEQVHDAITPDRSAANVLIRTNDNGSRHLLDVAEAVEAFWRERGPPGFEARTTGIMYEFARSQEAIAWGQIRGLSLAIVAIGGILLVLFRTLRVAAIALVPNLASLGLLYGAMGLVGVPLDGGTVVMGTLALGIAVDDTIHVVMGFLRHRRRGVVPLEALQATFQQVLPALVYTTLAIAIGFAALFFSEFSLTRNLGGVTAAVVMICLAADTTLLPAVLLRERGPGVASAASRCT